MTKLTIVVNCTERKSHKPSPQLQVRSLPDGNVPDRVRHWQRRVQDAAPASALIDLYQGEAWQQVRGLVGDATRMGFDVRLLVASAGLGLRDANSKAPAYAATFATGHPDTVAPTGSPSQSWWKALTTFEGSGSLTETTDERVLLVLSETYARAMNDELTSLARRGGDLLLVGGSRDTDGLPRIPADMGLRRQLGGTASSITLRMARRWLAKSRGGTLYNTATSRRWLKWADSVSELERYDRTPTDDPTLRELIRHLKAADPSLSATRALRKLRDSGVACEQKRFGRLFHSTEGAR
ncbi:MAG: hypothetical protein ACKOI2_08060 [Actinomycetota bacterium]